MRGRPAWEVLVGSMGFLENMAEQPEEHPEHPMQKVLEEFIDTLSFDEQELFYLRFGEQVSIRKIARMYGYNSHLVIQIKIKRIVEKARKFLGEYFERETARRNAESNN